MIPDTIIFVANSPGEIAGWLRPLVHEARERWPHCRLVLQLMICEFASGSEERIGREIGVEEVLAPWRYFDLLLRRMPRYRRPLIIHLGGDMFYSALLAKRWKVPVWMYLWGKKWLDSAFRGYFVRDERDRQNLLRKGISASKIKLVGDLVADATAYTLESQQKHLQEAGTVALAADGAPLVSFLPGSRQRELRALTPFFLAVAQQIKAAIPSCRFQIIVSPFIAAQNLSALLTAPPLAEIEGEVGTFDGAYLHDAHGTEIAIVHDDHLAHLSGSTLAITIPGTKTSELGCLGVPMIAILPLNRPDMLPLTGLLGMLDFLPYLGSRLKKWLVLRFAKRSRLYALPNILAQREIVPEIAAVITVNQVAKRALKLLNSPDEREQQSIALRHLYSHYRGAAPRIFDVLGDSEQWPMI